MLNHVRRFNGRLFGAGSLFFLALLAACPAGLQSAEMKKQSTGLYRDVFEQNIYSEGTSYLRLDRLYRALFRKEAPSLDVNAFDEVPDNTLFVNRHSRERLSTEELAHGSREMEIDLSGPLTVVKGKVEGLHPGFFVRDAAGNDFLLKFDSFDNFELATSAESITSRFYHAIGYNVPQYDVVTVPADGFQVDANAKIIDDTGFLKPLTAEKLEEYLLFVPRDAEGNFRASASKLIKGENKGYFNLTGRRKADPNDKIDHEHRRDVRALRVFASWLNNNDTRESNTMDIVVEEDGKRYLKHYLIDFNSTLGSASGGAKPPMFGHEYMVDYGETLKALLSLGLWEKPWQGIAREQQDAEPLSPAIGNFHNFGFEPEDYKVQLPHYAFKNLTRADGFWAAKIIKSFSDEDIRAIVETGKLSSAEDADYIAKTIAERRDLIAKYWFEEANPLDSFTYDGAALGFKDLSVENEFVSSDHTHYEFEVIGKRGNKRRKLTSLSSKQPVLQIQPEWFESADRLNILVRTIRSGRSLPRVLVEVDADRLLGIRHQN